MDYRVICQRAGYECREYSFPDHRFARVSSLAGSGMIVWREYSLLASYTEPCRCGVDFDVRDADVERHIENRIREIEESIAD